MSIATQTLIDLEKKFWQSMVDQDADTAIDMLSEPALMVSSHGAMKFDHAGYRNMVILDEGIPTWARKRYPTARAERRG